MRIALVNYLNSRPFLRGLEQFSESEDYEIIEAYPSNCARIMQRGEADIGLIPVGGFPLLNEFKILDHFCIGCDGAVKTVGIYSNNAIEEVEKLYLDNQSMTSVKLAKVLMEYHWNLKVEYRNIRRGEFPGLNQREALLCIGDRTAGMDEQYKYKYDLGKEWKLHTGKPFCFAAWVSLKDYSEGKLSPFYHALKTGIEMIPKIIASENGDKKELNQYFTQYIDYQFDHKKKEAIQLFERKYRGIHEQHSVTNQKV